MTPPEWTEDFIVAIELYREIIMTSPRTESGYPQLSRWDNVFSENDYMVDSIESVKEYIIALHQFDCKARSESR